MDEEPELKYSLLTNSLKDTIRDESITAFQVSFHFIILGTINGTVFVLDLIGNLLKTYENHAGRVNCIAIDSSEEYMSSGGEDGNVVVQSLYTAECQITSGKYPITCIQFEPDYSKMSRGLLSGGRQGELVLASKGWFGVSRLVIDSVESPILAAYWRSDYIVWITSNIAKFYNYKSASHFGHIDFDSANAYENFEPTVAWKSNEELIIGYKDSIRLVEIKDRDPKDVASGLSSKYVECKQQISVDFICCGVAPYKDMLLALGLRSDLNNNSAPQMYIVENDGEILSNDTLSLSNPKDMKVYAKEYQLGYQISENLSDTVYYIVSPWSIIVSKPRDVKDRVQWLLKFNEFERALQEIENSKNVYSQREKRETIITVGTKYIDKLLEENEFSQAASVCPRVYKQSAENWEAVVYKFAHHRKIHILYSVLPTENPVLSQNTYDIASQEFLEQDIELLYKAVKEWPFAIYSTSIIIKSIEALLTLTENQSVTLYLILSHLYKVNNDLNKSVFYAILAHEPNQIQVVLDNELIDICRDNLLLVMKYLAASILETESSKKIQQMIKSPAVLYVVKNTDKISPDVAYKQLNPDSEILFVYLVALFNRSNDQGAQYHDQLVELYCSYQPDQLLHFLKLSKSYSYQKAYDLCKVRVMVPEMLFLLGKMGANRQALNIIIERLEDVDLAIEFAKEKRDETLWDEFLNFSMDKPNFIVALLNNLGNYINPIRVIENIPPNLEIPGLQNAIIHTMADCSIQESLMDGCQKIFSLDIFNLMNTQVEKQQNGRAITPAQEKCSICNETIEDKESLLFFCSKHSYHSICLSPDQMLVTPSTPQSTSPSEFQKVMRKIDRIYNKSSNIFDTSASVKSNYLYLDPTYRFYCVKCLE